jgi:hypothetical protein
MPQIEESRVATASRSRLLHGSPVGVRILNFKGGSTAGDSEIQEALLQDHTGACSTEKNFSNLLSSASGWNTLPSYTHCGI